MSLTNIGILNNGRSINTDNTWTNLEIGMHNEGVFVNTNTININIRSTNMLIGINNINTNKKLGKRNSVKGVVFFFSLRAVPVNK